MKVAVCTFDIPGVLGGPNAWLQRLLPDLRRRGVDARAMALTHSTHHDHVDALRTLGVPCTTTVWPRYAEPAVRWLVENLAADPPDVFVAHCLAPAFYASRWARAAGIPTVAVMHSGGDPFYWAMVDQFVRGREAYRISGVVGVSAAIEQYITQRPHPGTRVAQIPCGVPLSTKLAAPPRDSLKLAYVGRLCEEAKRITALAQALCRSTREVPGTEAVIYGEGDARPSVERVLRRAARGSNGAAAKVRLAGALPNNEVYAALAQAHALVLLSDYEGLPVSVLEAMACGVVPICLNIPGGVRQLVEHEVTGLLVEDRAESFVAAVRCLRDDPVLWSRLSAAARARVERDYSSDRCTERWIAFMEQLRSEAGPSRPIIVPTDSELAELPPGHRGLAGQDLRTPHGMERVLRPMCRIGSLPWRTCRKAIRVIRSR